MSKKICIIIFTLLLGSLTISEDRNPLEGYVGEDSFKSGEKVFQHKGVTIFNEADAMNKNNSEAKIRSQFPQVVSVVNKGGVWHGTFYFVDSGRRYRKTIKGSGVVKGEETTYAVSIYEKGVRVRDVVSGITAEIQTKRR